MKRREFIAGLGGSVAAAWPVTGRAQARPTLGILLVGNRQPFLRLFSEGLRELGYTDGQNMKFELRSAEGQLGLLPELADHLVRLKVDLIVASETPAVQAAKRATS